MAVLKTVQGHNPGQVFAIEGDAAILGRHPDCDVVLESGAVSRQHARISCRGDQYYIEDLGSRNGTFLNGEAVVQRQLLSENDALAICDQTFVFYDELPEEDRTLGKSTEQTCTATMVMVDDHFPAAGSGIMSKLNMSSGSSSLQLAVNPEAKLKALIKIGQDMGKAVGLDEVLSSLLDSLFTVFVQADRGFIVLKDAKSGRLIPKTVKFRREKDAETARISRTILNTVLSSKEAILSADATADSRFDMAESIVDFHIHSMMCAPLVNRESKALGAILIDTFDQRSQFNRDDLDVLASVSCQAAVSVENARLHEAAMKERALAHELAIAHEVQRGFLPAGPPQIDRYEFFDFYEAANELGGDFYDYISLSDGRLAVVVADVSGKGISASLLVAKLSAEIRNSLLAESTHAEAIGRVNQLFCGTGWEDRFVTLVLCVLDSTRDEVTIVNAGHMPPLLRRSSGEIEAVGEPVIRLPLGVASDEVYQQHSMSLAPGENLTLYTDGITEAMNSARDLYGEKRLLAQLSTAADGVAAVAQGVLDDVKRFVGHHPQSDDMCMACFGQNTS